MGFRATVDKILRTNFDEATAAQRDSAVTKVVVACSLASAGLVLQPIPTLEQGVIVVQVGMVVAIAHIHGETLTRKRAQEVLMDLGAVTGVNVLGRQALTTLAKIILPGVGGVVAAPSAFAVTFATGKVASYYFKSGGKLDRDKLKAIFEEEKKRSRVHYGDEAARAARPAEADLNATDGERDG